MNMKRVKLGAMIGIPLLLAVYLLAAHFSAGGERKLRFAKEAELASKNAELAETQSRIEVLTKEKTDLESGTTEKIATLENKIKELEESGKFMNDRIDTLTKEKEAALA